MKRSILGLVCLSAVVFAGCGGEDVEVAGEITATGTVSDPITLQFFEIDADAARENVHEVQLAALGEFKETVNIASDSKLLVRALVDADADGKCTEGELWAEQTVTPKEDGTIDPITLALSGAACPVDPAPAE